MFQLYVWQWNFHSFKQLLVSLVWPFTGRTQAPHMTFNPTKRPTVEQLITQRCKIQKTGVFDGSVETHKLTAVLHTFHMRHGNRRWTWHWHPSQMLRAKYSFKQGANRLGKPDTKLNQMNKSSHMQMCVMFCAVCIADYRLLISCTNFKFKNMNTHIYSNLSELTFFF